MLFASMPFAPTTSIVEVLSHVRGYDIFFLGLIKIFLSNEAMF